MTNPITYVDTLNAALANNELESGTGISAGSHPRLTWRRTFANYRE
jgi:hypothetical protein